jgi:hypothetical protein
MVYIYAPRFAQPAASQIRRPWFKRRHVTLCYRPPPPPSSTAIPAHPAPHPACRLSHAPTPRQPTAVAMYARNRPQSPANVAPRTPATRRTNARSKSTRTTPRSCQPTTRMTTRMTTTRNPKNQRRQQGWGGKGGRREKGGHKEKTGDEEGEKTKVRIPTLPVERY